MVRYKNFKKQKGTNAFKTMYSYILVVFKVVVVVVVVVIVVAFAAIVVVLATVISYTKDIRWR